MANSSFTLDLQRFGEKTKKQMSQLVRKVGLDLLTSVIVHSPVDTGRFRANNQIDLNNMSGASILEFDPKGDGSVTIGRESGKLDQYNLGDTIFIYNNVAYAIPLEYGHSKQAPSGVYRISVEELVAHFNSIVQATK